MRVAIIGVGNFARKAYLPILTAQEGLDLFLHSRTSERLEQVRRQYRLPLASTELGELMQWQPEAAFVLTPSSTHYALVKQLLQSKVDVFLEKPATLLSSQTQELADLADAHHAILMVGFNRRFAPLHVKARQVWGDRPVDQAVFEKNRTRAYHPDIYSNFIDDTIHNVDLLRYFCGEAHVVRTTSQVKEGMFTGSASLLTLENGGMAVIATNLSAGRWTERFSLHGAGASLYVDAFTRFRLISGELEQVWEEVPSSVSSTTSEIRGITGEIDHFFECVRTRQQPITSGRDSVRTQLLVDEIAGQETPLK